MNTNKKCGRCGREEFLMLEKKHAYGTKIFIDSRGKRWSGFTCPECRRMLARKSRGSTSREESTVPQIVSALNAEKIAEQHFINLGFSVKRTEFFGPDLVCTLGELVYSVEVKRATLDGRQWRVSKVYKTRKGDDLVAMVLPNNRVYIDSMKHHLPKCGKNGLRSVTKIVREFGGVEFIDRRIFKS